MTDTTTSLCQIFKLLARSTWKDLQDAKRFDFSLGEETITDQLLLSLIRACPTEVVIKKSSKLREGLTTGADWEWWFCGNHTAFGMRVQAKRLFPKSLKYEGLGKLAGESEVKQVDLLLQNARKGPLYAIYCFYNYWDSGTKTPRWNCQSYVPDWTLFGCSVSDARLVKECIDTGKNDIKTVGSLSYPWMCIVCCTGFSEAYANLPERVFGVANALANTTIDGIRLDDREVPSIIDLDKTPKYVQLALEPGQQDNTNISTRIDNMLYEFNIDGLLVINEKNTTNNC